MVREPPKEVQLHALLKKPFGPYNDKDVLSAKFFGLRTASLAGVCLFKRDKHMNHEDTGLTRTEFFNSALDDIFFTGVLEIENKSWLSEAGRIKVEEDLRARTNLGFDDIYGPKIFGSHSLVKIDIRCRKNMTALYLTATRHPDSLVFHCLYGKYTFSYIITSLHVQTYRKSRRFLDRYRLLASLTRFAQSTSVKPHERTIDMWTAFIIKTATDQGAKRIIPNLFAQDSDFDHDSTGTVTVPRRPRHISTAEAHGLLALEAPWIIAQQLSMQPHKIQISISSLLHFCLLHSRIRLGRELRQLTRPKLDKLLPSYYGPKQWKDFDLGKKLDRQLQREKELKNNIPVTVEDEDGDPQEDPDDEEEEHLSAMGGFSEDSNESIVSSSEAVDSNAEGPTPPCRAGKFSHIPVPPGPGVTMWYCPARAQGCPFEINLLATAKKHRLETFSLNDKRMFKIWSGRTRQHLAQSHPW